MKLTVESGLWALGPEVREPPEVAVLEVSGAVLAWTVHDPAQPVRITFTDLAAADWLWRVLGEAGHVAVVAAVEAGRDVDLVDLVPQPEALAALRRLAIGHWLRRWWPTSARDGIIALDPALLDAEVALRTAALEDYFTQDTLDSDIADLLAPHRQALAGAAASGDPRVLDLLDTCVTLVDDVGLGDWSEILAPQTQPRRDDYALAAGEPGTDDGTAIARGVASVAWTAVLPRIFDAAENTVDWSVHPRDGAVVADISVATIGPADGVPVRLDSGPVNASGALDLDGNATLVLAITETQAWVHDWSDTAVIVGADSDEPSAVREHIRRFARARLATPGPDAFLAEILAAEADY
ncbi:hypothetical protein FZI85_06120 [Mycobacterium sp. CBMA293]|uniref:hypothetical protein n=1 Tax=unclassified Mycolicibacterium TaxID=2636767 RepID=UPI00132781AC|nr:MULTISPECIES: hypothetical protein [unclassified Mycolicibacterium]MUL45147.1 hypothetical protein [Mycolicibacterium sp. CBMA 360]MUL91752.1 hypothetical protein [Mycolicibacterium sp. CBMA 230]MUL56665.1 hypothetical protein [Mycolicibacterium sp. CBMA 335]MUL69704.1 hypothetical protein [Mycolicibacterium sp. CBMA 311]MUM05490.1 hypothetical protein [Mycolicibacterium sp. CBMA 213]